MCAYVLMHVPVQTECTVPRQQQVKPTPKPPQQEKSDAFTFRKYSFFHLCLTLANISAKDKCRGSDFKNKDKGS